MASFTYNLLPSEAPGRRRVEFSPKKNPRGGGNGGHLSQEGGIGKRGSGNRYKSSHHNIICHSKWLLNVFIRALTLDRHLPTQISQYSLEQKEMRLLLPPSNFPDMGTLKRGLLEFPPPLEIPEAERGKNLRREHDFRQQIQTGLCSK